MSKEVKPGQSTGNDGGIYREIGPRGGKKDNFATIPDNKPAPPTQNKGSKWVQVKRTPDSSR